MEVVILPDRDSAARMVAHMVARQIETKPESVLGLATGATMDRVYEELVLLHRDGLDFSLVRTFNLDEYVGLGPNEPNSYRYYMNGKLFDQINIDIRNTRLPDGLADDLSAECRQYEEAIRKSGGIDLQLLGLGETGHIGFNEPLSALRSRTREKALTPTTIRQNRKYFSPPESMPRRGITMGVGTILNSRRCVLLVTGADKAAVLARAVEGPITSMISASALQLHPHCQVVVDEEAAGELTQTEYYRWIFENEPEWQPLRAAVERSG